MQRVSPSSMTFLLLLILNCSYLTVKASPAQVVKEFISKAASEAVVNAFNSKRSPTSSFFLPPMTSTSSSSSSKTSRVLPRVINEILPRVIQSKTLNGMTTPTTTQSTTTSSRSHKKIPASLYKKIPAKYRALGYVRHVPKYLKRGKKSSSK